MNIKKCQTAFWAKLAVFSALVLALGSGLLVGLQPAKAQQLASDEAGGAVYIVPVKQTIESGLKSFLERAYKDAAEAKAERVVLVINTFGGEVTSAEEIGEVIRKSAIPTTAYIEGKAVSAGTYIALNAQNIVMEPGSTIGAAAVVDGRGQLIDNPKIVSYWTKTMMEAAKLGGRDANIAAAMVDTTVALSLPKAGIEKPAGEILSLSADEALASGYAEHIAASVGEAITWLKLDQKQLISFEPSLAEKASRWLVNPYVMTVLLILGIAGIVVELLMPGFGVPGILGIIAFSLYFFGHYVAGFAGMESIVLFVIGLALLIIEVFVPSFGILGLLGGAALVAGVVTAASDPMTAFISLVTALVVAVLVMYYIFRKYRHRGIWNKFILRDKLTKEEGYVSADEKDSLLGLVGVTLTPLRPAGTVQIGDQRIDVVTSGEFISTGASIVVIKAEGTWVVVKETVKSIT
ncbi:nodulation protein NfeD [Paenibacillus algorifonticola]|uniref:NfeD family protein n=1 Tax=Paenibacillus algorifonticola TaxID=684063 RepID=UPI003D288F26